MHEIAKPFVKLKSQKVEELPSVTKKPTPLFYAGASSMKEVSRNPVKNNYGTFQQLREIVVDNHVKASRNGESR